IVHPDRRLERFFPDDRFFSSSAKELPRVPFRPVSYTNLVLVSHSVPDAWKKPGNPCLSGTGSLGSCIRRSCSGRSGDVWRSATGLFAVVPASALPRLDSRRTACQTGRPAAVGMVQNSCPGGDAGKGVWLMCRAGCTETCTETAQKRTETFRLHRNAQPRARL